MAILTKTSNSVFAVWRHQACRQKSVFYRELFSYPFTPYLALCIPLPPIASSNYIVIPLQQKDTVYNCWLCSLCKTPLSRLLCVMDKWTHRTHAAFTYIFKNFMDKGKKSKLEKKKTRKTQIYDNTFHTSISFWHIRLCCTWMFDVVKDDLNGSCAAYLLTQTLTFPQTLQCKDCIFEFCKVPEKEP